MARVSASSSVKLASAVARQIELDVIAGGWVVGELLGTETDLHERYGVSRAVFREAVRLVEHLGIARTRRGPTGGLIVAEPSLGMVIGAVTVALLHSGVGWDELAEARVAIERTTIELAATRATDADVAMLRDLVVSHRGQSHHPGGDALHAGIGRVARNPAAALFTEIVSQLIHGYASAANAVSAPAPAVLDEYTRAHDALVSAIEAHDPELAAKRMDRHLTAQAEYLGRNRRADAVRPETIAASGPAGVRLAELVARKLLARIVALGWPTGQMLGAEADLMEEFGIGRAVFREAVRLLEHHGVACMKRGPGGGLTVTAPDASGVAEAVSIYLAYRHIRIDQLMEMRRGLELRCVALAAERIDADGLALLRSTYASETEGDFAPEIDATLHIHIAALTGNRVLALFTNVLTSLTSLHANRSRALNPDDQETMRIEVQHVHELVVEALAAGNAEQAVRRMRRHLDAMEPWLS
jgi:DNA-binding FadR family transcriptional regulator